MACYGPHIIKQPADSVRAHARRFPVTIWIRLIDVLTVIGRSTSATQHPIVVERVQVSTLPQLQYLQTEHLQVRRVLLQRQTVTELVKQSANGRYVTRLLIGCVFQRDGIVNKRIPVVCRKKYPFTSIIK